MLRDMTRPALLASLILLVLAPSAPAAAPLPVGEAQGVRAYRVNGAIVVRFTDRAARLYPRIAGKRVTITCTELPEDRDTFGILGVGSGSQTFRAPKRRRPFRTGDLTRGTDYCRVWLAARTVKRHGERQRQSRRLIVSVSLTREGAVYLDEQEKAISLFVLLIYAGEQDDGKAYPTPAVLLQAIHDADGAGSPVVQLVSPASTPPPGTIGYYSDGALHAAAVTVSASGRRLFIEVAPNDVLHTNVGAYTSGDFH